MFLIFFLRFAEFNLANHLLIHFKLFHRQRLPWRPCIIRKRLKRNLKKLVSGFNKLWNYRRTANHSGTSSFNTFTIRKKYPPQMRRIGWSEEKKRNIKSCTRKTRNKNLFRKHYFCLFTYRQILNCM